MDDQVNIYRICKNIQDSVGMPVLTLEFEVMLELYFSGELSAGEVLSRVRASQASFSVIARRMLEEGLLVANPGYPDRRRTIYSISERARQIIAAAVRDTSVAA